MSMVLLNFNNTEDLVFSNKELKLMLPMYKKYFDQWNIAHMVNLRTVRHRAILDFLNSFENKHISILEKYFNDLVKIDKSISYRNIRLIEFPLQEAEAQLNEINPLGNVVVYRNSDQLYLCFWQ